MNKPKRALKKIPTFKSEDAEREFWATADSTEYVDWSKARRESTSFQTARLPASRSPLFWTITTIGS